MSVALAVAVATTSVEAAHVGWLRESAHVGRLPERTHVGRLPERTHVGRLRSARDSVPRGGPPFGHRDRGLAEADGMAAAKPRPRPLEIGGQVGGAALGADVETPVHGIVVPASAGVSQQHVVPAVAVEVADAGDAPVEVGGEIGGAALGTDVQAPVHGVVEPVPPGVTQHHVIPAVAVEVPDAGDSPVEVGGEVGAAALGADVETPVHGVVVPASLDVSEQHVVLAVAVEVADAGDSPVEIGGEVGGAALGTDVQAPVHGIVEPASPGVSQQHVVLAVAVEVADAGDAPVEVCGEVGGSALGADVEAPVHGVVVPASLDVSEQHVVLAVAVEVSDAGDSPVEIGGEVGGAALGADVQAPVHGVVEPVPPGVSQQHVVLAVAVEVAQVRARVRGVGLAALDAGNGEVAFGGEVRRIRLRGVRRRRDVDHLSGARLQQAHHLDGSARGDEELPPSGPVAEPSGEAVIAGLELLRGDAARSSGRQGQAHLASGRRRACIVSPSNRDIDTGLGEVDQTQQARVVCVAGGVEDRHPVHGVASGLDRSHDVVHRDEDPVRGPDVCRGLEVEVRRELQAPISSAVAQAPGQALRGVAGLEIPGVEMPGLPRAQRQGDGAAPLPGVVGGMDGDRACLLGVIDDSGKPLPGLPRGREQREDMTSGRCGEGRTRGGQVDRVSGARLQQADYLDGSGGGDGEPPPSGPVAESAGEALIAGLDLLRRDAARPAGRQRQAHLASGRRRARIVAPSNRHVDAAVGEIGQAQPAHLVPVAAGVEEGHPMHGVGPDLDGAGDVVHGGEESVRGMHVCRGLDVEVRGQLQAPISSAVTQTPGQTLGGVAGFEIPGVEVPGLPRAQGQGDGAALLPGVVGGVDDDRAGMIGVIDDPGEPLLGLPRGGEQREGMLRCPCDRILGGCQERDAERQHHGQSRCRRGACERPCIARTRGRRTGAGGDCSRFDCFEVFRFGPGGLHGLGLVPGCVRTLSLIPPLGHCTFWPGFLTKGVERGRVVCDTSYRTTGARPHGNTV